MKRIFIYGKYALMLALAVSFCACSLFSNMEVPERVSVKTDARFSVALGKKTVDMNEIFGEKLQNGISSSVENLDVFKYVPDKNDDTLQYLLHNNIYNFDLNIGEQLNSLNMDDMLSGADGIEVDEKIQVPEIKSPEPIGWDLPDVGAASVKTTAEMTIDTKISLGDVKYINDAVIDKGGTIEIKVEKPAGTQGITLEMESLSIDGAGLGFKENDFVAVNDDRYLLFQRLDFSELDAGKRTLKFSNDNDIKIDGKINVTISKGATCSGLSTKIEVNLKKIENATADFSELFSFKKIDEGSGASRLPEDMLKYVTKVSFGEERGGTFYKLDKDGNSTNTKSEGLGIKCKIVNSLPKGNDIDITMKSKVFDITETDSRDWKISSYGNENSNPASWAVFKEIDFNSNMTKYNLDNPPYMDFEISLSNEQKLYNLEFGKQYSFSLKDAQFVFDWDSAEVKLDALSQDEIKGENDLSNLSRETLFGNVDGELGEFVKNIEFSDITAYFYAQKPSDALDSLVGKIKLEGNVKMIYSLDGEKKTEIILDSGEEFELSSPVNWKTNSSNEFTIDLKKTDFIEDYDMAKILNEDVKNLKIIYDLDISGGQEATVYAAALDSLGENASTSISVDAAIVFPLKMKIRKAASLDILELANFDSDKKDLLDRESVDDMDDYEEYADYLDYIRLEYNLKNNIVKGLDFTIEVDDEHPESGYTGIYKEFEFSEKNLDFKPDEAKKILTNFFMPKIHLKFNKDTDITISRSGLASEESFSISPVFAIKFDGDSPICITDILNK